MQRTTFLLGTATAGAGRGADAGASAAAAALFGAGACTRRYCSLSRTVPFHWHTFLPGGLLAPDGVLSALRLMLGPALAEIGGANACTRVGPPGARSTKRTVLPVPVLVAALQKLRTGTGKTVATCCCTGKTVRFAVCSAISTCTSRSLLCCESVTAEVRAISANVAPSSATFVYLLQAISANAAPSSVSFVRVLVVAQDMSANVAASSASFMREFVVVMRVAAVWGAVRVYPAKD